MAPLSRACRLFEPFGCGGIDLDIVADDSLGQFPDNFYSRSRQHTVLT